MKRNYTYKWSRNISKYEKKGFLLYQKVTNLGCLVCISKNVFWIFFFTSLMKIYAVNIVLLEIEYQREIQEMSVINDLTSDRIYGYYCLAFLHGSFEINNWIGFWILDVKELLI